jgi:hypothetical protein
MHSSTTISSWDLSFSFSHNSFKLARIFQY